MPWTLFQLEDCHLCEEAAALAHAAGLAPTLVDIGDDDALDARYGVRIPVLRHEASGRELDWPFDAAALAAFVAGS
jgi:hypothetical protein